MEAGVGPVWVAADDLRIIEAVDAAGGKGVMTRFDHPSGSDRIFEALGAIDAAGSYDIVVNVQGDLPTVEGSVVRACLAPLADDDVDIATLATPITRDEEKDDPNVVKAVATELDPTRLRALYFTRARAPWGEGRLLHHIGLYACRREALRRFVAAPPSPLEKREKLEQLRALEAGMRVDIALVDTAPLGVDAPEDLERARMMLAPGKRA
jgi:3-deoxy-manno-octulosonate cytidylyltransferase (CMP-KDO synthetase)